MSLTFKGIRTLGLLDPVQRANMRGLSRALRSIQAALPNLNARDSNVLKFIGTPGPRGNSQGGNVAPVTYGSFADRPTTEQLQQRGVGAMTYISNDATSGKRVDIFDGSDWQQIERNIGVADMASGDTTPSVRGISVLVYPAGTAAVSVTYFDDGQEGQEFTLWSLSSNAITIVASPTLIKTAGGANVSITANEMIKFFLYNSVWHAHSNAGSIS